MKKSIFILFLITNHASLLTFHAHPQSCLPAGITFATQEQIDSFQVNHPNCMEIEGDVTIAGDDISNLNGLSVLTAIGGSLHIGTYSNGGINPILTNLTGLDNLTHIGGSLWILGNELLTNLSGLDNVTSIGGEISVYGNTTLTSLSGLEGLSSIEGDLIIGTYDYHNPNLTSLSGLDNVNSIGGNCKIWDNVALTSLGGLDNLDSIGESFLIFRNTALSDLTSLQSLTSIGGALSIGGNTAMTSLSGLDNLTSTGAALYVAQQDSITSLTGLGNLDSIGGNLGIYENPALVSLSGLDNLSYIGTWLNIYDNPSLSSCEMQGLCDYLLNPNGSVYIVNNATGCNNPPEIADACGVTLPCLPFGKYYLTTQSEIDNFATDYPDCSQIEGDLTIDGEDITNLDGLSVLTSIGEDLIIGATYYDGNPNLTSLTGLGNLTSIGGFIRINTNAALTNLTGLNNIDAGSIEALYIYDNPSLSMCEVRSVCDYLSIPESTIAIYNNEAGCDSREEVEAACSVGVEESSVVSRQSLVNIYPNPSSTTINIELPNTTAPLENTILTIYTISGKQIFRRQLVEPLTVMDVSGLNAGIYFVKVADNRTVMVGKVVKI